MDSSLIVPLVTNAGVAGLVVVLIVLRVLVPGWYAKKLEQQNELLSSTADKAVKELALANQMIGELRAIALQRAGAGPGGDAGGTHQLAQEP